MNFKLKTTVLSVISMGVLAGAMFASAQTQITAYQCANGSIVTDPNACVVSTTPSTPATCFNFTRNLSVGNTGADVKALQETLNSKGFAVAPAGQAGSAGYETTYFGNATKAALIKWQEANAAATLAPWGLSKGTGFFGSASRAEMNKCVPGTVNPTDPNTNVPAGAVTVALSSSQPNNVLVAGSARATLGNFVFTGNGVVTSVKLQRSGISDSDTLGNIYLYDTVSGQRLTDAASAAADGTVTINNGLGLFTVAGSKSVSVMADVNEDKGGQSVGFSLIGYTVAGNPAAVVSGVNGPNLPIGTATLASVAGVSNSNVSGGDLAAPIQNRALWRADLNVQTRTVNLSSVALKMVGSLPASAIANAGLYLDGVRIATAMIDSQNMIHFNPGARYPLTTGSHTLELRADVLSGASRSFSFILENSADIVLEDSSLMGAYITMANYTAIRQGGTFTVSGVTTSSSNVTVYKDSSYSPSTVPAGQNNLAIAKYKLYGLGEDVKITSLTINPEVANASTSASSSIVSAKLQNVSLVVSGGDYGNGTQVGSTNNKGTDYTYTLNSQLILRSGVNYTLEVRADLVEQSTGRQILLGTASANLTSFTVEGLYSYNVKTDNTVYTGQQISVGGSSVVLAKKVGGVATTASKNQADVKIGSFQFQVGNVEDVEITNMSLNLDGNWNTNQITNVRLSNSQSVANIAARVDNYFSPYNSLVGKNAVIQIDVLANLNEISDTATIIPVLKIEYTGKDSRTRDSKTATGDQITLSLATVGTPTVIAGNAGSQYIVGNSTQDLGSYKFTATNGSVTIKEATFSITGSGVQSVSFAGSNVPVVGSTVTMTGLNYVVPQGTLGINIPVEVTYAPVSNTGGVTSGAKAKVTLTGYKYEGGNGLQNVTGLTAAMNEMTLVAAKPAVSVVNTNTGLAGGTQKLVEFTVATTQTAPIKLDSVKFNVSVSSAVASAASYKLYANGSEITGASCVDGTGVCTLPSDYEFVGSQTLALYATVSGALGTAGSSSITTSLDAAGFMWTDTAGGSAISTSATLVNGFPTNSWTLRN